MYSYPNCGFEITLLDGYRVAESLEGSFVQFDDLEGLHVAISRALIDLPRRLTKEEFRFLRKELDLGQRELGELLEVTEQTISLWERGLTDIPKLPDVAVRALIAERYAIANRPSLKIRLRLDVLAAEHPAPLRFKHTVLGWQVSDEAHTSTATYVQSSLITSLTELWPALEIVEQARSGMGNFDFGLENSTRSWSKPMVELA